MKNKLMIFTVFLLMGAFVYADARAIELLGQRYHRNYLESVVRPERDQLKML